MEFTNQKLEEFNQYVQNKRVAIIGLGVSNLPLLKYFHDLRAKVTVFDNRSIEEISKEIMDKITEYNFEFSFGKDALAKLNHFNLILRSPSCMPNQPALEQEARKRSYCNYRSRITIKNVTL